MDIKNMHSSFKGRRFRYAPMVSICEDSKTSNTRHCIKVEMEDGRWIFIGSGGDQMEYDCEADARSDAEKLNQWASS